MRHSSIAAITKQQGSKGKQPSDSSDRERLLFPDGCLFPDWNDTLNLARIFGCMLHTSVVTSNDAYNSKIGTKHIPAQHSTAITAQHSTAQHSTAQRSAAQNSMA